MYLDYACVMPFSSNKVFFWNSMILSYQYVNPMNSFYETLLWLVLIVFSCNWTPLPLILSIDDLCGKALARAVGALLSVTSVSLLLSVTFALLLCLLKAAKRLQIGWNTMNVGQEVLAQTWASERSPNVPETSEEAFKTPPGAGRCIFRSRGSTVGNDPEFSLLLFTV